MTTTWTATRHQSAFETLETPSGRWLLEYGLLEYAKSADHGPLTYRSTYAVTFLSEDGRRVQFTTLGSLTRGEVISTALWSERCNPNKTIVTGGR